VKFRKMHIEKHDENHVTQKDENLIELYLLIQIKTTHEKFTSVFCKNHHT